MKRCLIVELITTQYKIPRQAIPLSGQSRMEHRILNTTFILLEAIRTYYTYLEKKEKSLEADLGTSNPTFISDIQYRQITDLFHIVLFELL